MMHRGLRGLAVVAAILASIGSVSTAVAQEPDGAEDTAPNDVLVDRIRAGSLEDEYRTAVEALDELLARPDGHYDPVLQAWVFIRYGDLRRGASLLLPIASNEQEFERHANRGFLPMFLGALAYHRGDRDQARQWLRSAVDQYEHRRGQMPHVYAIVLQSLDLLGQLYREGGEHRAARECIREMREITKYRSFAPNELVLPDVHDAELFLAKGEVARAAQSIKAVERHLDKPGGLPKPVRARILANLGAVATRRGEVREAERRLKEALGLRESIHLPFHSSVIDTQRQLVNLYMVMGRPREALAYAARAAELADKRARHLLSMGSERQKRISARQLEHDTDTVVSLHMQDAPRNVDAARLALTSILRRKGMVFEAMVGNVAALREKLDAEGQALADELADVSTRMSTMMSRGPVDVTMADFQNDLFDLEEQRRRLEESLATHADRGAKSGWDERPLLELGDVQRNIPDGGALVEFFEYRPHRPFGPPVHPTWGKPRMAAYILHKTGEPQWADLGSAHVIEETAKKWIAELSTGGNHRALARQLYDLVVKPLRGALGSTQWILASPDGALNFVPLYALVDERDRDLIETMSITYLMTGRDLTRWGNPSQAPRENALIVANPAFGKTIDAEANQMAMAEARAVDLSRVSFPQLPATEEEGVRVRKTLDKALLLAGVNATEEAIKGVRGPRILHIATHGFFLPDIVNATGDGSKAGVDPWNANPLLRSGLALRGANGRRSETEKEDGILTALEVSNLDLHGTRLVVLSACETGVGQALIGEGVYGLQRAIMIAGAETQVTSLWQVDDNATKNLMVRFYEELAKGAGRGDAMRTAQLSVRQTSAHPYYWASFVVTGSGATLDGKPVRPSTRTMEISPGVRGCACGTTNADDSRSGWVAGVIAAIAMIRGRRVNRG